MSLTYVAYVQSCLSGVHTSHIQLPRHTKHGFSATDQQTLLPLPVRLTFFVQFQFRQMLEPYMTCLC